MARGAIGLGGGSGGGFLKSRGLDVYAPARPPLPGAGDGDSQEDELGCSQLNCTQDNFFWYSVLPLLRRVPP